MQVVFVSSSFTEPDVEAFLTQLLAGLNGQDLDARCYRGGDDDRIRTGVPITEQIQADVRASDLFIALVSERYVTSPFCLKEAKAALEERARRQLPILVAVWPSAPSHPSDWPDPVEALVTAPGNTSLMYYRVKVDPRRPDPNAMDDQVRKAVEDLCKDACCELGVEFEENPDPVGHMQLIMRTKQAVRWFPPAEPSRVDGDLRALVTLLGAFHRYGKRGSDLLRNHREAFEEQLGVRATSFLRLGEGAFLLLEARISTKPSRDEVYDQVQSAADDALKTGDVFTQRDACVLLGNLALEMNVPDKALDWHLRASKIAHLIEDGSVKPTDTSETVHNMTETIPPSMAICPKGISAYIMFDNLMKCWLRLLFPLNADEIAERAAEWRKSVAYSDPNHFARYGSLLVFGYAFSGRLDGARELLEALEAADGGHLHVETWRVMLALATRALQKVPGSAYRHLAEPIDWLASQAQRPRALSPEAAALLNLEASYALRHLQHTRAALAKLSWAVEQFPASVHLRVERAALLVQLGEGRSAHGDCVSAAGTRCGPEAAKPFKASENNVEVHYARGMAYWFLGQRHDADKDFRDSHEQDARHYSHILPEGFFGAAAD